MTHPPSPTTHCPWPWILFHPSALIHKDGDEGGDAIVQDPPDAKPYSGLILCLSLSSVGAVPARASGLSVTFVCRLWATCLVSRFLLFFCFPAVGGLKIALLLISRGFLCCCFLLCCCWRLGVVSLFCHTSSPHTPRPLLPNTSSSCSCSSCVGQHKYTLDCLKGWIRSHKATLLDLCCGRSALSL